MNNIIDEIPAAPPSPHFESKPTSRPIQWLSILQLAFSILVASNLFPLAAFLLARGLRNWISQGKPGGATSDFLFAVGLVLCGLLLLPSAYFALLNLIDRPIPVVLNRSPAFWRVAILILVLFVLPASLVIGGLVVRNPKFTWMILPFMHVLATGIPILFVVSIGLRGFTMDSPRRLWGLFGAGLALGPLLIFLIESLFVVAVIVLVIIYVSSQPSLVADLSRLVTRLRFSSPSQEELVLILQPYLTNPAVVFSLFSILAGLIPLIEEILKPVGMVFLIGRSMTPSQGFSAGILSGAGYALCESIFRVGPGSEWLTITIARSGTGAIHILATGLVGLGLAYAWGQGKYLRLGILLITAMSIHGLWNALSLLSSAAVLLPAGQANTYGLIGFLANASPYGLVIESLVCIVLIGWINLMLRKRGELHGLDSASGSNLPASG